VTLHRHSVQNVAEDATVLPCGHNDCFDFPHSDFSEVWKRWGHRESDRQSTSGRDLQNSCEGPYTLAGVRQPGNGAKAGDFSLEGIWLETPELYELSLRGLRHV
jgi:hypothetical protein